MITKIQTSITLKRNINVGELVTVWPILEMKPILGIVLERHQEAEYVVSSSSPVYGIETHLYSRDEIFVDLEVPVPCNGIVHLSNAIATNIDKLVLDDLRKMIFCGDK